VADASVKAEQVAAQAKADNQVRTPPCSIVGV